MRKGDYMFTIDHFNGFHQLALQENLKPYCCFRWGESVYRWEVLPFGVCVAPRVYTKIFKLLLERWREQGIRCSGYIDDSIFFASSYAEALRVRERVLQDLEDLGVTINSKKAALTPTQCVSYLGYLFDTSGEPRVSLMDTHKRGQIYISMGRRLEPEIKINRELNMLHLLNINTALCPP